MPDLGHAHGDHAQTPLPLSLPFLHSLRSYSCLLAASPGFKKKKKKIQSEVAVVCTASKGLQHAQAGQGCRWILPWAEYIHEGKPNSTWDLKVKYYIK